MDGAGPQHHNALGEARMWNPTKLLLAMGAAIVLIPAPTASAQRRRGLVDVSHRHERHGAWLTFGLGAGRESFRFSNVPGGYSNEITKPSFWLAAGGTVNPHLRLGGEINRSEERRVGKEGRSRGTAHG